MCYSHDHIFRLVVQIEYVKREAPENKLAYFVLRQWVFEWSCTDFGDGIVNGVGERGSREWAAFVIPLTRFPEFGTSLGVKPNSHPTGRIIPRALLPKGLIRLSQHQSQPPVS